MITITIENNAGEQAILEIPDNINLSLMEILKAADYDILAPCGGIALCATCAVQVLKGLEQLPLPGDQELDMLDTLPHADQYSRLACQLQIDKAMDGMVFRLVG